MAESLAVIGAGNMGYAIVEGIISAGILPAPEILVIDINQSPRQRAADLGCVTSDRPNDATTREQILVAVKPQSFPQMARQIGTLRDEKVIISIMAGVHSEFIREALGEKARVIRVMPNTPCRVRAGMAAVALGTGSRKGDERLAMRIFSVLGEAVEIEEDLMNAVTAVSGSGPAYFFLLAEAMEQAAQQIGLSNAHARQLVAQTLYGSAVLLRESAKSSGESSGGSSGGSAGGLSGGSADILRQQVTSPGGTTAAAMEVMFERELPQIVAEAVIAARDRGQELDLSKVSESR